MNQSSMTIKQALQLAIEAEIKAYNLYSNLQEKVIHAGTKSMLSELAEQEKGHQAILIGVLSNGNYRGWEILMSPERLGIVSPAVTIKITEQSNPQEIMIFAINEEQKAINFYAELQQHYQGNELEKIFANLTSEEQAHKIKLEREYEDFFMREN
jgi:rubrerythrin